MTDTDHRLDRLERAVFTSKDDWPTGHGSLQEQLDELFHLVGNLMMQVCKHSEQDRNESRVEKKVTEMCRPSAAPQVYDGYWRR